MDISIILCTYNPDKACFKRVLEGIFALETGSLAVEFVLVDNNSSTPVSETVHHLFPSLAPRFDFKTVKEPTPGLLHARMKGFAESTGQIIVFFDDDNVPQPDYLLKTSLLFDGFPTIGVAGPGRISVEFVGEIAPWVPFYKGYFQERNYEILNYACYPHWLPFYPPGTGQVVRRGVYAEYLKRVEAGTYSAVGRTKSAMTSAEDVQLVFCAILMEYAVATAPGLALIHLIAARKTTVPYLKKLLFGMSSSYPEAYAECFPHTRRVLPYFTNWHIFKVLVGIFHQKLVLKRSPKAFVFQLSETMGKIYGSNRARGGNAGSFWFFLINIFKMR